MHYTLDSLDVPPPSLVFERRHQRDRRTEWRGGRRNADWIDRPVGGWERFGQQQSAWRHLLSRLAAHLLDPVSLVYQAFR